MSLAPKKVRTNCNECRKHTNHQVLYKKRISTLEDITSVGDKKPTFERLYQTYMIVQCDGCNEISFLHRLSNNAKVNEKDSEEYMDFNFPSNNNESDINLLSYDERCQLPRLLSDLYWEVGSAFNDDSKTLAGVGLRMLVEALCLEQKIKGINLQEKIKNLHASGLISANEVPILDKLRLIGNFSAHEIKGFSISKLQYALDIVNHVLKSIYILPRINKKLKI